MFLRNLVSQNDMKRIISYSFHHSRRNYPTRVNQITSEKIIKLHRATVVYYENKERIFLSVPYGYQQFRVKNYNFNRSANENIESFIPMLQEKLLKFINMKLKKRKVTLSSLNINILENFKYDENFTADSNQCFSSIEKSSKFHKVFVDEAYKHVLNIEDSFFYLDVNPPQVDSLKLSHDIRSGCCMYPHLELRNATLTQSCYEWYVSQETYCNVREVKKVKWQSVAQSYLLHVDEAMEGKLLKLVVQPSDGRRTGDHKEIISSCLVTAGPKNCPYKLRQKKTNHPTDVDRFRVMSYNLLADTYARTKFSAETLFPTCPPYALNIEYRKQLLIDEILGYKADLICLQEVDRDIFRDDLNIVLPLASGNTLEGNYAAKDNGLAPEGVATFYNNKKFRLLKHENLSLSQELQTNETFGDLRASLEETDTELLQLILERTTVLQVSCIERVTHPSEVSIVGNTHLYFHPKADRVRLVHGLMSLCLLQQRAQQMHTQNHSTSLIFCGDFNSLPQSAVVKLFTERTICKELDIAQSVATELERLSLAISTPFSSACAVPPFTNYAVTFSGCLDWIFYQPNKMSVTKVVPLPSLEEVKEFTALPSPKIPSDHLALVAELSFARLNTPQKLLEKAKAVFEALK